MQTFEAEASVCWYAVQTKPKQEQRASMSLQAGGIATFSPQVRERSPLRIGTGTGYRLAPLFPGYIFARFSVDRQLPCVRTSTGVQTVVRFGGVPAPLEDEVIAMLEAKTEHSFAAAPLLRRGDHVVIRDGPFRSLAGIFEQDMGGSERVAVLLDALSWRARVVIDAALLAKVD